MEEPLVRRLVVSVSAALLAAMLALTGCGGRAADTKTNELVIYSGRRENLVMPVLEAFEKQTGVKVVLKAASATELANLIIEEKSSPKADIYLSNDAGALERLRMEKVLEPYTSENLKKVPEDLRAVDNTWYAVTVRSRVIMYNKNLVAEADVPKSLRDLADPKWKGQVGMATGANESVIANVTALRITEGDAATEKFLADLVQNGIKVYKGHGDVRQAVGRGEIKLGWVNDYYYYHQLAEKENNRVGIVYPDQDGRGVTVNVSGAAIVKNARNVANAKRFMDFLLTPETQKLFAEVNYEKPVLPGVPTREGVRPLTALTRNPVRLGQFGAEWDQSVRLVDRIGLVLR
jgi:iron(III) transport system substrate-binding protein